MMRNHSILVVFLLATRAFAAEPTTSPITIDVSSNRVIELFDAGDPRIRPTTQPESIVEGAPKRGKRDRAVLNITTPSITCFLPPATQPTAGVIVIPGGGYGREVFDREGYFVADALSHAGIAAFVLKYQLPASQPPADGQLPVPAIDVFRAIRLVRAKAGELNLNPRRVGVMGFSAGGHVAGSAATEFADVPTDPASPIDGQSARPDFAVLMYAVSSMHASVAHLGSRKALLGPDPSPSLEARYSTAERITRDTPPLFVCHAEDDKVVKVENSIEVAAAAAKAAVPCQLHLFKTGGHGFAIPEPSAEPAAWFDEFVQWLQHVPLTP